MSQLYRHVKSGIIMTRDQWIDLLTFNIDTILWNEGTPEDYFLGKVAKGHFIETEGEQHDTSGQATKGNNIH